jgi:pyruvate/2-oxoglutarate/acetoin dehydrogenase E1 component
MNCDQVGLFNVVQAMNRFARIRWMMRNSWHAPLLARLPQKVRHSIDSGG